MIEPAGPPATVAADAVPAAPASAGGWYSASARRQWRLVLVLLVMGSLGAIDRQVITLLVNPIRETLRIDGHLRALRSAGIGRVPVLEVPVRFGSDAAYDGVSALLDAHAECDGVFACSDVIAMSAMRALVERGRRVPADVAVAGFDDIPLAAYTTPPLTTVRQDCTAGARILVDKLLQLMAGQRAEPEVIPTELVVRASSLRQHHRHAGGAGGTRVVAAGLPDRPGSGSRSRYVK